MRQLRILFSLLLITCLWLPGQVAMAADTEPAAEQAGTDGEAKTAKYINLFPALVGNLQSTDPRLRYYKAEVSLRVNGDQNADKVKTHLALIRDRLVFLFMRQNAGSLVTVEAKEKLRQEALKTVQDALTEEAGAPVVEDLLFTNLVIQ